MFTATKITDMTLPYLTRLLRDHEAEILSLIDTDPLLRKRERHDGLVIANAGKALYEPEFEHQMFAKGIVYQRNPYRLVSLPLVKIHNYGAREVSNRACNELCQDDNITLVFPEKKDGTMIQIFEHDGQVLFTTRSVLEDSFVVGQEEDDDDFIQYTQIARELAEKKYPELLNPDNLAGLSLVLELIHPQTKVVTDYGDREELCLLAVFELGDYYYYWGSEKVATFAKLLGTPSCQYLYQGRYLLEGLASVEASLGNRKDVPEGVVICFEKDGVVLHRVKYKLSEYLKRHAMKFSVSLKTVTNLIWNKPELHNWQEFLSYLKTQGLTDEEVEAVYKGYFTTFSEWNLNVKITQGKVISVLEEFRNYYEGSAEDFQKTLALWARANYPELFHLIMTCHKKNGDLTTHDVMKILQPYPGFKSLLE